MWKLGITVSTHDHPTRFWKTYVANEDDITVGCANGETQEESVELASLIVEAVNEKIANA